MTSTSTSTKPTYLIVGATRGIGREFARQLLCTSCTVIATARGEAGADGLVASVKKELMPSTCAWQVLECDVESDESVELLVQGLMAMGVRRIDFVVLCAGVLVYPGGIGVVTYDDFTQHMRTNAIGPLIVAQKLLRSIPDVRNLVFLSSDSGSAGRFRPEEDGFGAYAASKAALNQGLRHLAAELNRHPENLKKSPAERTVVMALHPGEVETDMANVDLPWDIGPTLTPSESVRACLAVIRDGNEKTRKEGRWEARFWTWEGVEYPW